MAIRFLCPLGHPIKAADHRSGKKGRCPVCHQKIIVPVPNPEPSGSEKRSWDAPGPQPIEFDEQAPASAPIPGSRKRRRRLKSGRSIVATELLLEPTPQRSEPIFPKLAIDDSSALAPLPPPLPPPSLVPPPVADRIADRITVPRNPSQGKSRLKPEPPPRWVGRMKSGYDHVYRADAKQIEMVYWLAAILLFAVVFGAAPALRHWQLAEAPVWARIVLLVAAAQLVYIAWLVLMPDWSTIWVGMVLFALVGAGYGASMALVGSMPQGKLPPMGLAGAGSSAAAWCGANVLVMGLLSFACGRLATKWRRSDVVHRTAPYRGA